MFLLSEDRLRGKSLEAALRALYRSQDIANGSLLEVETQPERARALGSLPHGSSSQLTVLAAEIGCMLNGMKTGRKRALTPGSWRLPLVDAQFY